ncbi:MAG TPA: ribosomal L7Ae/L30e/S12e/Gadd45 family protein [Ruminiclostridium sp.]|nr:ribosomal L7Ae/L30e/S12e/Gadd45 family protein [Ruminiclostridium sp.]
MNEKQQQNPADRILGLIGIARRAGKITFGFDAVVQDIFKGRAKGVFLSSDASERTSLKIKDACLEYKIRLTRLEAEKSQLGTAIGRGDTAVIAVLDKPLAERIAELSVADDNTA